MGEFLSEKICRYLEQFTVTMLVKLIEDNSGTKFYFQKPHPKYLEIECGLDKSGPLK